jgi:hypothetical protein
LRQGQASLRSVLRSLDSIHRAIFGFLDSSQRLQETPLERRDF